MNKLHREVKSRLALLGLSFQGLARQLNVSRTAVYRAVKGDPFMHKLRDQIISKLDELESLEEAA